MSATDLVAVAIVALCALWAGRGVWRWWRGRGACGCSHCPLTRDAEARRKAGTRS